MRERRVRVRIEEAFVVDGAVAGFRSAEEEMLKQVQHDNLILIRHDSLVCGEGDSLV